VARTQAADYGDRRAAIVERAAALYAHGGFLGASIAELAQACGISKSLLYHYFSSKEDILFEVMIGHVSVLQEVVAEAAKEVDPEKRLRALTRGFMELYVDAASRHKVLVNDLDKLPEVRRSDIVARERSLLDVLNNLLSELSPPLSQSPEQRRVMTMLYFGMINWTHTWFRADGPVTAGAVADMVVDTMLRGLPR
jgi:AcrR family transcriptional regulator